MPTVLIFFLLLRAKEITGSDSITITAYILYNLVYACSSYPMGVWADKIGMKKILLFGLFLFVIVYTGFAINTEAWLVYVLFAVYGVYAAATEGIAKAWITNTAHEKNTATAIGYYTSCQSIAAFFASVLAGILWQTAGSRVVFLTSASISLVSIAWLTSRKASIN